MQRIAVTSRSFSKHHKLRAALSQRYQHVQFNDDGKTLQNNELIDFLKNADGVILGLERLNADILAALPQLKVVSRFGVGLDTLDLPTMQRLGIRLASTLGANKRSVAELVIAFAIQMLRQLPALNQEVKAGQWHQRKGRQLSGCAFGIVGLGEIGKDLASLLTTFDCKIFAYDIISHAEFCDQLGIFQVDLETLLQQSTIISLHLPFNPKTALLLNQERLHLMRPDAILINTARGGLVDEAVLKEMLITNQLAAAAFDVFSKEPPIDQTLLTLPNFFATPHIGGSTEEAILAMGMAAIEGLEKAELIAEC